MRIIGGFAKGLTLATPQKGNQTIRPTSDRAREALFSILGKNIHASIVLDLYAGTGALGLEAFSRGALYVVLVDYSQESLMLIKKNSLRCLRGYKDKGEIRVVEHDLRRPLYQKNLPPTVATGFDFIFADPPYGKKLSLSTLDFINNSSLLKQNGILIVEEQKDEEMPERLSSLECVDQRLYGDTAFYFYMHFKG